MRSSAETEKISPQLKEPLLSLCPTGFNHPKTRTHVRLLGPCFKTGRMKSYDRQQPKLIVVQTPERQPTAVQAHCKQSTKVDNWLKSGKAASKRHELQHLYRRRAGTPSTITHSPRAVLPFNGSYRPPPIVVDARKREMRPPDTTNHCQRSIRIRTTAVEEPSDLNLANKLLIPCASLLTVSRTI